MDLQRRGIEEHDVAAVLDRRHVGIQGRPLIGDDHEAARRVELLGNSLVAKGCRAGVSFDSLTIGLNNALRFEGNP